MILVLTDSAAFVTLYTEVPMATKSHISPITFGIPFLVMFIVVGVAMFAAGTGTDLRSLASNDNQKSCVSKCIKLGGSVSACTNVCPKILKGSMTCEFAAKAVGVNSPVFMKACEAITPKEKSCDQICSTVSGGIENGNGVVRSVCKRVCPSVKSGEKTCDVVCNESVPQTAQGKSYMGACLNACKKIPVDTIKSDEPKPVISTTCAEKCRAPSGINGATADSYRTKCMSICSTVVGSGSKSCSDACSEMGSTSLNARCMQMLCPIPDTAE